MMPARRAFLCAAAAWPLAARPRLIAVIAHRGDHTRHPENSIAAFEASIALGCDFFEADVRTSSDGRLAVIHDASVDRTTRAKGVVRTFTVDQLRALGVPSFDEVLECARGRSGVYVDVKDCAPDALIAALDRHAAAERAVIYAGYEFLTRLAALRPDLKVMPEATSVAHLRRVIDELRPRVIAFDARDFTGEVLAIARPFGASLYVDRLGALDNPSAWQDAVDHGADAIQTDRPAALIAYLQSKGHR